MDMSNRIACAVGIVLCIALAGCACCKNKDDKSESREIKMPFAEAPGAVRNGLHERAPQGQFTTVEKEMKDGRVLYEADVVQDGKTWEIVVDEQGKFVSMKEEKD